MQCVVLAVLVLAAVLAAVLAFARASKLVPAGMLLAAVLAVLLAAVLAVLRAAVLAVVLAAVIAAVLAAVLAVQAVVPSAVLAAVLAGSSTCWQQYWQCAPTACNSGYGALYLFGGCPTGPPTLRSRSNAPWRAGVLSSTSWTKSTHPSTALVLP